MKDINGITIKTGDLVATRQPSGGVLPPGQPEQGIVEPTIDAFGNPTMQIRFRKAGRDFDQFILLDGKINEVIIQAPTQEQVEGGLVL